mmetsp:Transcript_8731/g.25403  ORF Transcript_8731/g.25403 Transcript_8731/m.25403 type:complete len:288 (-) Transcript_8731:290-1153(-)
MPPAKARGAPARNVDALDSDESSSENEEQLDQLALQALNACSVFQDATPEKVESTAKRTKGKDSAQQRKASNAAPSSWEDASDHQSIIAPKHRIIAKVQPLVGDNLGSEREELARKADEVLSKSSLPQTNNDLTVPRPGAKPPKRAEIETRAEKWFGMRSSPLDADAKYTLAVLASRHAVDPKRHYRKERRKPNEVPKLFQIGTIVEGAADFFSSRISRKDRRANMAEEILADDRLRPYLKNKFGQLQEVTMANGRKAQKKKEDKRKPKWLRGAPSPGNKSKKPRRG